LEKSRREFVWRTSVVAPLVKLLKEQDKYFDSRNVLNSDGRKFFESIARIIVREKPWYKPLVVKARKNPTLENILRLAEELVDSDTLKSVREELYPLRLLILGKSQQWDFQA